MLPQHITYYTLYTTRPQLLSKYLSQGYTIIHRPWLLLATVHGCVAY